MNTKNTIKNLSELEHQKKVIQWATINKHTKPELKRLFQIPNGLNSDAVNVMNAKRSGLKRGVSDLFLSVPKRDNKNIFKIISCGLYIEMKKENGVTNKEQLDWIKESIEYGYEAMICYGYKEAVKAICTYLNCLELENNYGE